MRWIAIVFVFSMSLAADVEKAPSQPYLSTPSNRAQPRESIFEFYLRALNPHRIPWGDEIDRRISTLLAESARNPYFRICAIQTALNLALILLCWLWWDKTRQVKWTVAAYLTDALNAKAIAERKAIEAIERHNRHMEACNRVVEEQQSGIPSGHGSSERQHQIELLQKQLADERSENAKLHAELARKQVQQAQMESRLANVEARMKERREEVNAALVTRDQRAEADLGSKRPTKR